MDTSTIINKCQRCGTEKEPGRRSTKPYGGMTAVSGALISATFGGSVDAGIGAIASYFAGKATIMSIKNDHDMNQCFKDKYPNPKCGYKWKEKNQANDNPDNQSWVAYIPY